MNEWLLNITLRLKNIKLSEEELEVLLNVIQTSVESILDNQFPKKPDDYEAKLEWDIEESPYDNDNV